MAASLGTGNLRSLEVENLSKHFGDSAVLTNISFSVHEREIVGFIGPNGVEHTAGAMEMDAPLFDLNYGLPNLQLKLEVPVRIIRQEANRALGLGAPLLGVTWRFLADEKSQIPQIRRLPAGAAAIR